MSRQPARKRCQHQVAYAVRADIHGQPGPKALVCRRCGAVRTAPVFRDVWTRWGASLRSLRTSLPDGAAMTILAGPSDDMAMLRAVAEVA